MLAGPGPSVIVFAASGFFLRYGEVPLILERLSASWNFLGGRGWKQKGASLSVLPSGARELTSEGALGTLLESSWALSGLSWSYLGALLGHLGAI